LEESVAAFDARIVGALAPFRDVVERLKEVPALGRIAITTIIAEIGPFRPPQILSPRWDWLRASMTAPVSATQPELNTALPR